MKSAKSKLLIVCFCLVASYLAIAGVEPSPFRYPPDPCRRIETAYEWEGALVNAAAQAMTEAQLDEYMSKLRDPNNEVEGEPYPSAPKFAPAWLLYAYSPGQGDGIAAEDVGNPSEPGLVQVWGCNDLDCGLGYSAWTYDFGAELDLSNTTIGIVVTAPNLNAGANYIDNVSFGIQTASGKTRTWHWDVPEDIPWDTPTPISINTALTGLAATDPPATHWTRSAPTMPRERPTCRRASAARRLPAARPRRSSRSTATPSQPTPKPLPSRGPTLAPQRPTWSTSHAC